MKLKKQLKKDDLKRLQEDNYRYVSWIKDMVNIIHNSDIAVNQLVASLNAKPGEEVLLETERVKQLQTVYKEVLETFTYDSEEEPKQEEVSTKEA